MIEEKKSKNWKKRFSFSSPYFSFFISFFIAIFSFSICHLHFPLNEVLLFYGLESQNKFFSFYESFIPSQVSFLICKLLEELKHSSRKNDDFVSTFLFKFLKSTFYSLNKMFGLGILNLVFFSGKLSTLESFYVFFLFYFVFSSINYLMEFFVYFIEKQGMFDGYNLNYFIESVFSVGPLLFKHLSIFEFNEKLKISSLKKPKSLFISFLLFFSIIAFTVASSFKWETQVETNKYLIHKSGIYPFESSNEKTEFGFEFKFSPFSILLPLQYAYYVFELFFFSFSFFCFFKSLFNWKEFFLRRNLNWKNLNFHLKNNYLVENLKTFSETLTRENFFGFEEYSNPDQKNLFLFFILKISFLTLWQISNDYFISRDISLQLEKSGTYFDGINFQEKTKKFIFSRKVPISMFKIFSFLFLSFIYEHSYKYSSCSLGNSNYPSFFKTFNLISSFNSIVEQVYSYNDCVNFYD